MPRPPTARETWKPRPAWRTRRLTAETNTFSRPQRTIRTSISLSGRGVHTGNPATVTFLPAEPDSEIVFVRTDLPSRIRIPATLLSVQADALQRRTTIQADGVAVHTVEHVLSAASGLGVDNLIVEINGDEPPFLDGSAALFVQSLRAAGIVDQPEKIDPLLVDRILVFREEDCEIVAIPSSEMKVTFFFTSDNPLLKSQSASVVITANSYADEIAPARTFCFFHEVEPLLRSGLIRGGNLQSSLVIGRKSILNQDLRYPDEPVRHKILDFIGDLALIGKPLAGHFLVWRGGHRHNVSFGRFFRREFGLE